MVTTCSEESSDPGMEENDTTIDIRDSERSYAEFYFTSMPP
jgi:hypothetical protein